MPKTNRHPTHIDNLHQTLLFNKNPQDKGTNIEQSLSNIISKETEGMTELYIYTVFVLKFSWLLY